MGGLALDLAPALYGPVSWEQNRPQDLSLLNLALLGDSQTEYDTPGLLWPCNKVGRSTANLSICQKSGQGPAWILTRIRLGEGVSVQEIPGDEAEKLVSTSLGAGAGSSSEGLVSEDCKGSPKERI